jgi:hypothetical protein
MFMNVVGAQMSAAGYPLINNLLDHGEIIDRWEIQRGW